MKKTTVRCHLMDILAEVPDPRKAKGKRHPLVAILALGVVATLSGAKSYAAIAEYGRSHDQRRESLGFTHSKTPCAATFYNVFTRLDAEALTAKLTQWATLAFERFRPSEGSLTGVAIDGKTLRKSNRRGAKRAHLLSVVSHDLGITLCQKALSEKDHEIPASRAILKAFDVAQKVITTDALLTQRRFSEAICGQGGDYLLPVKANQPALLEAIESQFRPPAGTDFQTAYELLKIEHQQDGEHLDTYQTTDTAHGRIETRRLTCSTMLNEYLDWPGIQQVFEYTTERKNIATGEVEIYKQYGNLTSLSPQRATAADLLKYKRGHWSIENKSHWIRDTVFGEDASQVRAADIPAIMAALRNTAIALLRFAGHTHIAKTTRYLAAKPKQALKLLTHVF